MTAILDTLKAATDGHAAEATADDLVAGVPARWVARPGSTAQTSALLTAAAEQRLTVVARGAGTKLAWGATPECVDLVVDTTRMSEVVEHAAGDLVVVAGAGRTLDELQADLAPAGQRLGVDPPRRGTLGGAVATASTGPGRLFHGAVRDLLIGVRFVRADGVAAHAGGKVVKNVAGYDLGKVLTGSFGTLGVITEVAFRLHPVPGAQRWISCPAGEPEGTQALVSSLAHSQLAISSVELDRAADGSSVSVLVEGTAPGVEQRATEVLRLMGSGATEAETPPAWWGTEPDSDSAVLIKVTHEISRLGSLLQTVDEAAADTGLQVRFRGSPVVGTALLGLSRADGTDGGADADGSHLAEGVRQFVDRVRAGSGTFGGSAVVLEAPAAIRDRLDVWGPVEALGLMRSLKSQFDPERRLAPGRFVGGI